MHENVTEVFEQIVVCSGVLRENVHAQCDAQDAVQPHGFVWVLKMFVEH